MSTLPTPPTPPTPPHTTKNDFWNWLWHSDHLFMVRSGLFLLGETILLQVVLQAVREPATWPWPWVGLVIGTLLFLVGIALSLAWLLYCWTYSEFARSYISKGAETTEPLWKGLQEAREDRKNPPETTPGKPDWSARARKWAWLSGKVVAYAPPIAITAFWILVWAHWIAEYFSKCSP